MILPEMYKTWVRRWGEGRNIGKCTMVGREEGIKRKHDYKAYAGRDKRKDGERKERSEVIPKLY